ncbi:hypothetical protein BDK88_2728 [Natrinema hispanicum]|uniref:Uncharacterized protein n=1 Tax=Natrinema hispanicum TaxID=392421 RepID=A0A482Y9G5_9EURY|nr:hypothetical protein [Natrinema hispanicum]RZV08654.1 hypothetical protein BDK88_2728 [Natrinema hispanicum]
MGKCARCGTEDANPPKHNRHLDYEYCDECQEMFDSVWENGVVVRSRHSNRAFDDLPYEVSIRADDVNTTENWRDKRNPQNQVEALGEAKKAMETYDLPGLFIYQKTGSVWLIDEYLETHPKIRGDVEDYNDSSGGGFLSNILF